MTPGLALLFLAQMVVPGNDPAGPSSAHPSAPAHAGMARHPSNDPRAAPPPRTCIRIVNVTCVPEISLALWGTNGPVAYPDFKQGTWTGNAPLPKTAFHYVVRSASGSVVADRVLDFPSPVCGTLLLTGDLGTTGRSDQLAGIAPKAATQGGVAGTNAPNVQFRFFTSSPVGIDPCQYRIVNAMPSKSLTIRSKPNGKRPSRQLALLAPGDSALFVRQPPDVVWEAWIDGEVRPLEILQEGIPLNCIIPFFLRQGRPDFIRVFEDP
jgi:hypothetical protein